MEITENRALTDSEQLNAYPRVVFQERIPLPQMSKPSMSFREKVVSKVRECLSSLNQPSFERIVLKDYLAGVELKALEGNVPELGITLPDSHRNIDSYLGTNSAWLFFYQGLQKGIPIEHNFNVSVKKDKSNPDELCLKVVDYGDYEARKDSIFR